MPGKKGKSGGHRPGAGRPTSFKARNGNFLIVERSSINEAKFYPPELGQVVGISNQEMEIQIGNEVLVIRFPEPGEIGPTQAGRKKSNPMTRSE